MKVQNQSSVNYLLIVGFSDFPQLQVPLFALFLLIYLFSVAGNVIIMTTIYFNSHLHTPMYFFLTNLSFNDICYITVIFPHMLAHFFQEGTQVSFTQCLVQLYCFMGLVLGEYILLSIMAYDRYVAICKPLRYTSIMSMAVCTRLAFGTWVSTFIFPLPQAMLLCQLSFCKSHTINHFFCDITALLKISCSNTGSFETLTYVEGAIVVIMSFNLIIFSYIKIISSILNIKSKGGRHKAFSTCVSHLTIVVLFYGSIFGTYVRPTSTYSVNKISSLSYIAVTPLCNPIIYSLKNTEFKNAFRNRKSI